MYEQCCYNKLRLVGKAVEVSHKSGGKRQRAAGALLYIVNKDVGEAQQRVAGDIVTRVSTTAELGFDTQRDNQSKPLRYHQMSQVALGKSCWWQQGYCFIFMLKKNKKKNCFALFAPKLK